MNLRGAKPVSDNKIKQFIESLDPVKDLYNPKLPQEFKYEFVDWILSSQYNFIKGVEEFPDITLCNGTVQAFDHFHRFFKGEFMYHQACLKNGSQFEWINDIPLQEGDALVLSVPFSDRGIQHPATDMLLLNAEQFNIPVLLDFAYYPCTKNINLNLSKYPAVETITFSISKAFYGAEFLRVGVRLERANTDDGIDVFNSVDMHNRIDLSIASSLIKTFPVDWNWKTYTDVYTQVCEEKNLRPTDCIMFGLGGNEYKEYNRGGEVNRVCISDLIGEKINDNSK
jgi:hypothetical protein